MAIVRRIGLFIAAAGIAVAAVAPTVSAHDQRGPVVTHLAEFGSDDFVTGSTIGPDGALYVTDGSAGEVLRIDRRNGRVSTYATGLPPKAFQGQDIGGPVDVAFMGRTAYVLVTLVSGLIFGEPFDNGNPNAKNGLYRIERDGTPTLIADLGQWSADHPPQPAFFVDTGVQFAMQPYFGGFLVTDGHHNRVLWVSQHGSIHEVATFENVVPTGLETIAGFVFVTQMGPIPHAPEDGKVLAVGPGKEAGRAWPAGRACSSMSSGDHEAGSTDSSQGQWDGVGEGSRALAKHRAVGRRGTSWRADTSRGRSRSGARPGSPHLGGVRREHRIRRVGDRRCLPGRGSLTARRSSAAG